MEDELQTYVGDQHLKTDATNYHKALWSKTAILRRGLWKTCCQRSTQLYKSQVEGRAARCKQYMKQMFKELDGLSVNNS